MCVSWFSPSSLYDSDGIDAFNVKFAREDYFVPEMEDLGMQPIDYSRLLPPWASLSEYRLPDMSGAVEEYYSKHLSDVKDAYDKLYRNSRLSAHGRALGIKSSKFPAEKFMVGSHAITSISQALTTFTESLKQVEVCKFLHFIALLRLTIS